MSAGPSDSNWVTPDGNYLYDYSDQSWWSYQPPFGDDPGGWVASSAPAGVTPPPLHWAPGDANHPPDHPKPGGDGPPPPKIPGGSGAGGGGTSVDTPSLDLFVANVKLLVDPVNGLVDKLKQMTAVQPGAFYHADLIRGAVTGDNGDAGLRAKYHTVSTDLGSALVKLHEAVASLSTKYKSTEEANKGSAADVQKAFDDAASYFSGVVSDAGGGGGGSGPSGA